jgi:molybdenum cofactor cytidylyltransferase
MSESGEYHAIILAAGEGARFGGSKLTEPWDGGILLDAALRSARSAPVKSVLVVTGAHADAVEEAVELFASNPGLPVIFIRCADHALGMAASLRCGLSALPGGAAGAFIFLGDMPHVPATLPALLLDRLRSGARASVPAVDGRWGHPVLISRSLFDAFSGGAGDGGGRDILRGLGKDLAVVETGDPGILKDVDFPADLEAKGGPV